MFRKEILLIVSVIGLYGTCPAKADLVFESGRSTFDDSYPLAHEVWVINDAVLDVVGGEIVKLGTGDSATVNVYGGTIKWLWTGEWRVDESVVNIWGGTLTGLRHTKTL